jgi:hypothetical protein
MSAIVVPGAAATVIPGAGATVGAVGDESIGTGVATPIAAVVSPSDAIVPHAAQRPRTGDAVLPQRTHDMSDWLMIIARKRRALTHLRTP